MTDNGNRVTAAPTPALHHPLACLPALVPGGTQPS